MMFSKYFSSFLITGAALLSSFSSSAAEIGLPDNEKSSQTVSSISAQHLGWGGGGAFTSIEEHNSETYMSSDVAGVWKLIDNSWEPMVEGLDNYNVTSLVSHNGQLLAVTSTEIFSLNSENVWQAIGISIATQRNTSRQVYAQSNDGNICFAGLKAKIACLNPQNISTTLQLNTNTVHGIYFDKDQSDMLYAFNNKELFQIDLTNNTQTVIKTFENKIMRITRIGDDLIDVIFTQKEAFLLRNLQKIPLQLNKSLVNVITSEDHQINDNFIALGNQWSAGIYSLTYENNELVVGDKVAINYDNKAPHRNWRRSITTPVGMPTLVGSELWFADYWGVYRYSNQNNRFEEHVLNASNFVGTDIEIRDNTLYIASMDNGLVSVDITETEQSTYKNIFPRTGADWRKAGHVWSVKTDANTVYASISPWNQPSDFILAFNEHDKTLAWSKQLGEYTNRWSNGAFWGQGYSRQLIIDDNNLYTFRDGDTGGLFKTTKLGNGQANTESEVVTLSTQSESNRVYRAVIKTQDQLVSYHIEDTQTLRFTDIQSNTITHEATAPNGFWAFDMKHIDDAIYLLGAYGGATIYKYENDTFVEFLKRPRGSTFHALALSQDKQLMMASSVNWGTFKNSEVLFSIDEGDSWLDATCLMDNKSGAVDIEFDSTQENVYVLMQVGGLMKFSVSQLKNFEGC